MNVLKDQAEVERLAEEILSDKQLIIDLDRRRNSNREALACFRRGTVDRRPWFFTDGLVLKMGRQESKSLIEADQAKLDTETEAVRLRMKQSMVELQALEASLHPDKAARTGAVTAASYALKPVDAKELMQH
ncbi:hypothetical protein BJ741DRAFT_597877 [Chytriomyces cf. hyalinus JEL632]|nr:hypothetical protein BJ741DRAFT_597877 [Chytriomyces cf. hyalinus JEL632]